MIRNPAETLARPTARSSKSDAIVTALRDFVLSAEPDRAIRSERELATLHHVTVGTIRRVLKRLADENLIYTVHGRGSFVAPRRAPAMTPRIIMVDDWGDAAHPFYVSHLRGLSVRAGALGYRLEVRAAPNHLRGAELERLLPDLAAPETIGLVVPWLDPPRYRAIVGANPKIHIVSTNCELREPGTVSILPDYTIMGRMAARYLAQAGAQRIVTAGFFHEAMYGASHELGTQGTVEEAPRALLHDADAVAAWLLASAPEGVAFFDDRLARDVLSALTRRDPDFVRRTPGISASNAGDDILPREFARLELDGTRLGELAVNAIRSMHDGVDCSNVRMLVAPRFVAPGMNGS